MQSCFENMVVIIKGIGNLDNSSCLVRLQWCSGHGRMAYEA